MANDEPKKFSDELKALRAEFAEVAEKSKAAVAHLTTAIFKQEMLELRQQQDTVVATFAHHGVLESVGNRDVTILVNKSKDMGNGLNSALGQGIDAAARLRLAAHNTYDMGVSASIFEAGASKSVNISDYDRMEKAREKTEANNKELVLSLREIMVSNTPDKEYTRNRHYVIVSDGSITDSVDAAAKLIEGTLRSNPKATFDFINVGANAGNIHELVAKVQVADEAQRPRIHAAEKAEDIWSTFNAALRTRIGETPYVKPAPDAPAAPQPTAQPTP